MIMNKSKFALVCICMAVSVFLLGGCEESYANKKQAMETKWQKSAAFVKIPVMEELIEQGELQEAKKMLEKCLREDPFLPGLHLISGRINFIDGRTEQARLNFQKAVELDPTCADGWHLLGSLALMEKEYEPAQQHYEKALELAPAHADYRVSLAEILIEQNQIEQAKEILQAGQNYQPRNMDLLLALAQLYQRSENIKQAVQIYEQAQLMHGNHPRILEPCGYAYVGLRQWDKAAEKFEQLLGRCEPGTSHYQSVLRALAMCAFNAERYGLALSCYDKLAVAHRDDPQVWMGMAQSALGLDDTTRAVYCAKKALHYEPGWTKGYAVLGSALYMNGDYRPSLDAFERITGDAEFSPFAWFMTGRCYQQLGQTAQADHAFDRAEAMDPENELVKLFLKRNLQSL